jgi:hypothetical protein
MTRSLARALLGAFAAALIFGAPIAGAANPNTPTAALRDCSAGHDPLVGHYSVKVLQQAQADLKTSSLQYTTCEQVLHNAIQALLAHRTVHHPPPPGGKVTRSTHSAAPSAKPVTTAVVNKRLSEVRAAGSAPAFISGQTVTPGAVTVRSSSFLSGLPTPLLIVLAALLATVVAVGARAIHQIVRTRRSH